MHELFLYLLVGVAAGIFTGFFPGIHVNLVLSFLALNGFFGREFIGFAVGLAVMHSFAEFFPSIFLGIPGKGSFLSVLPGHRMVLKGNASKAIFLTIAGGFFCGMFSILLFPFFEFVSSIANESKIIVFAALCFALMFFIFNTGEKSSVFANIASVVVAGFLGFYVFSFSGSAQKLLVLVSGFFGAGPIIFSVLSNSSFSFPKQKTCRSIDFDFQSIVAGSICSFLVCIFPGIGAGFASVLASKIHNFKNEIFLFANGGITTSVFLFSFAFARFFGKARTGFAAYLLSNPFFESFSFLEFIFLFVFSLSISSAVCLFLAPYAIRLISKISLKKLSVFSIGLVFLSIALFSNMAGLLVFLTATCASVFLISLGGKRTSFMSFIIVPVLFSFF